MSSLAFSLLIFSLLVSASESRSVADLRDLSAGAGGAAGDAAVDLNITSFESFLKKSPAAFAIVEFFAHWCPACRNYKPHYEKVARLFNGPNAVHPGMIVMTRVDCADKMNTDLCDRFSVVHYPMLLWGPPTKFTAGKWDPKQKDTGIQSIEDGRTAERLLNWINKQLGSSFNLDDEKYENESSLPRNASDPGQIARTIFDVEEATAETFDIIVGNKMVKSDTHASLTKFFQLMVAHHPSKRCRRGTAELLVNYDDFWHSDPSISSDEPHIPHDREALKAFHICGKEVPRGYWIFCRGSKNDTRGYSCGLWVLFHSLSVRVTDGESHLAFTTICDFVRDFFICDECSQHFGKMCSRVSVPFNTTRDFALWLWNAHNEVNKRLMIEEKQLGTGDPNFPKIIWPHQQLCPSCYQSQVRKPESEPSWNQDEVFRFLRDYYGKTLISAYKDEDAVKLKKEELVADDTTSSTNPVVVPLGAALAIALASCAFGALACFWRQQQKNRKYIHQLHSFKNI